MAISNHLFPNTLHGFQVLSSKVRALKRLAYPPWSIMNSTPGPSALGLSF